MSGAEALIRPARPDDVEPLRCLVERAYRGESARQGWTHEADMISSDRTSLSELEATLADPDKAVLVALDDQRMIGTVTVAWVNTGRCYLGMLAVDPDCQAGGLGKRLVTAAEQEARSRFGATEMEMTVITARRELRDWYIRQGYAESGEQRELIVPDAAPLTMEVLVRTL